MGNFKKEGGYNGRDNRNFGAKSDTGGKSFGGNNHGGNRNFGGNRKFGEGRDTNREREMYRAMCSDCGRSCEVPFRPSGDKPVFCSACFQNKGSDAGQNVRDRGTRSYSERDPRPRFEEKKPYQQDTNKQIDFYKSQFESLHVKMDTILNMVSSLERENHVQTIKPAQSEKIREKGIEPAPFKKTSVNTPRGDSGAKITTHKKGGAKESVVKKKTTGKAPKKK